MGAEAKVYNILRFLCHGDETNESLVPLHEAIRALGSSQCLAQHEQKLYILQKHPQSRPFDRGIIRFNEGKEKQYGNK